MTECPDEDQAPKEVAVQDFSTVSGGLNRKPVTYLSLGQAAGGLSELECRYERLGRSEGHGYR